MHATRGRAAAATDQSERYVDMLAREAAATEASAGGAAVENDAEAIDAADAVALASQAAERYAVSVSVLTRIPYRPFRR